MGWLHRSVAALAALSYAGDLAAAMPSQRLSDQPPVDDSPVAGQNHTNPFADYPPILNARQEDGGDEGGGDGDKVELRILPLGASIMSGVGSPEHSGLRKWVRMALRNDGYPVNMVGTRRHGTDLKDNDHEATSGDFVGQIREALQLSLPYKPNLVMINGGTNNAIHGEHVDDIYDQMDGILQDIWGYDGMGDTCVILSTLIPTEDPQGAINRITINSAYRRLVKDRRGDKCIYLADMEPTGEGKDFITLDGDYWDDSPKVHPNNEGHKRMAYVFYAAILRALRADEVVEAAPKEEEDNTGCDKEYGTGISAGALTQVGWGHHDGTYTHGSESKGVILEVNSEFDRNQWRFARLFSREYDDLVGWFEFEENENDHRFGVWKNSADGEGSFEKIDDMNPEKYCIPRGLHFIDMNADGLDDHVCIHPNGDISVSVNNGDGEGNKPPSFTDVGVVESTGSDQGDIVLGDIDGDGRGDYGIINQDDWTINWYRNGGTQDKTEFWEPLGKRVEITPQTPMQWRFEDLNGDGRDDMLWVRRSGQVITHTNTRSCKKGRHGDGLNVAWRRGYSANAHDDGASTNDQVFTHHGMLEWHDITEDDRRDLTDRIFFARVYGTKPAFGNLGVQDYVFIENVEDGDNWTFKVRVWKNTGSGGTKVIADGNKYGNMQAHEDGRMDYVWTWSHGKMHKEQFIEPGGDSYWGPETVMWEPPEELDRRDLHLKDWDGDGVDDIIWVDPKNGNVRVWINEFRDKQSWDGAFREIDPPNLECEHTRGIGIHDLAVRFADITGNGRADYLCIDKDGKVVGYTQSDDGEFEAVDQIKFADGMDRANLRWADVNGDGRDDMIWINKFNGDGTVLYNRGPGAPEDNGGSSFHWEKIADPVYQGSQAGTCMYFPEFNGDGRADMHGVKGTWTNEAETWYNPSCGMTDMHGDDEEGVVDPELPVQEGNPLDGPGPGEEGNETPGNGDGNSEDCRELDNRDWRGKQCTDKFVESHTDYSAAERWGELDASGAWTSALEFVQCRRDKDLPEDSFSNTVSDFFNGPDNMYCELWTDSGNKCSDLALQCHDVVAPAGYHVLNSLSRIYDIGWNLYRAIDGAVQYAKDGAIADEFGLPPEDSMKPSLQITLDIFLMVFGMASGFHWNKGFGMDDVSAKVVKDETNDMIKNSITLGKDIHTASMKAKDDLGVHVAMEQAMEDMALSWKNATERTNEQLFDGSAESNAKLDAFMADGTMIDKESLADTQDNELRKRIEKVLNAAMIPMAWKLSPDGYYPVIIREEIGCDEEPRLPWASDSMRYITQAAFDKRYCGENTGGVSYWLLAGENYKSTCGKFGANNPKCKRFDSPAGFSALETNKYDVSLDEVMQGAIATWEANGQKNGYKLPEVPDDAWLDQILEDGLTTPGVFNIPICTFSEARNNWYDVFLGEKKEGDNFPCDTK